MASFIFRKVVKGLGGGRFGSTGSYTNIANDRRQTMTGTGKVYKDLWIPATQFWGLSPNGFANWQGGAAAITGSTSAAVVMEAYGLKSTTASPALIPVLGASVAENQDARATTTFFAPPDAATTGCSVATLYYSLPAAQDTAGSMEVWRLRWAYTGVSGCTGEAGLSGSTLTGTCNVTTGCGHIEAHTIGSMKAFSQASPFCVLEVGLENSNTCAAAGAPTENVIGVRIRYIADSLGTQVT